MMSWVPHQVPLSELPPWNLRCSGMCLRPWHWLPTTFWELRVNQEQRGKGERKKNFEQVLEC